jgi:hypothetical protein
MIWEFDKFWVIWVSCLDQSRTLKHIQKIWGYKGNALYQKGEKLPIWKEMVDKGILEEKGSIRKRGVSGKLLYGKFEWVNDYLKILIEELKFKNNNPLLAEICECFSSKEKLIEFLDGKRDVFFSLDNIKILFGGKENLKNFGNLSIFCPILTILIVSLSYFLKEEGAEKEILSLVLQPVVLNPNFSINFPAYFKEVVKKLKVMDIPKGLVLKENLFKFLMSYVKNLAEEIKL